jgi:hypothetical protein
VPQPGPAADETQQEKKKRKESDHVASLKDPKKHVPKENRTQQHGEDRDMLKIHQKPYAKRDLTTVRTELKEFILVSFNVRGLNEEAKQKIVYDLLKHNQPQVVCFNETKLQTPLYL